MSNKTPASERGLDKPTVTDYPEEFPETTAKISQLMENSRNEERAEFREDRAKGRMTDQVQPLAPVERRFGDFGDRDDILPLATTIAQKAGTSPNIQHLNQAGVQHFLARVPSALGRKDKNQADLDFISLLRLPEDQILAAAHHMFNDRFPATNPNFVREGAPGSQSWAVHMVAGAATELRQGLIDNPIRALRYHEDLGDYGRILEVILDMDYARMGNQFDRAELDVLKKLGQTLNDRVGQILTSEGLPVTGQRSTIGTEAFLSIFANPSSEYNQKTAALVNFWVLNNGIPLENLAKDFRKIYGDESDKEVRAALAEVTLLSLFVKTDPTYDSFLKPQSQQDALTVEALILRHNARTYDVESPTHQFRIHQAEQMLPITFDEATRQPVEGSVVSELTGREVSFKSREGLSDLISLIDFTFRLDPQVADALVQGLAKAVATNTDPNFGVEQLLTQLSTAVSRTTLFHTSDSGTGAVPMEEVSGIVVEKLNTFQRIGRLLDATGNFKVTKEEYKDGMDDTFEMFIDPKRQPQRERLINDIREQLPGLRDLHMEFSGQSRYPTMALYSQSLLRERERVFNDDHANKPLENVFIYRTARSNAELVAFRKLVNMISVLEDTNMLSHVVGNLGSGFVVPTEATESSTAVFEQALDGLAVFNPSSILVGAYEKGRKEMEERQGVINIVEGSPILQGMARTAALGAGVLATSSVRQYNDIRHIPDRVASAMLPFTDLARAQRANIRMGTSDIFTEQGRETYMANRFLMNNENHTGEIMLKDNGQRVFTLKNIQGSPPQQMRTLEGEGVEAPYHMMQIFMLYNHWVDKNFITR